MKTNEFNENYELDRKTRGGIRANPKHALAVVPEMLTANGATYDSAILYYFFDESSREVRPSTGFRRTGEHLCAFGLKIVAVGALHTNRDDALADGQQFFNAEIERLRERIRKYEAEKLPANRSLKAVLTSR